MQAMLTTSTLLLLLCVVWLPPTQVAAFSPLPFHTLASTTSSTSSWTALEMGKSRKARKLQRVEKSRPKFLDAIEDAEGTETTATKEKPNKKSGRKRSKGGKAAAASSSTAAAASTPNDRAEAERQARMADAEARMEARPDVSTILVDEESGMEIVQQGKNVMDVITRRPVKLSDLGPEYRLAQMFPGVPPAIREKYRMEDSSSNSVTVDQLIEGLKQACQVPLADGKTRGIPPHPSVANKAIDYVLANRDLMGRKMKHTLGRLTMRAMSENKVEEGQELFKLWKHYETLENHISAPFRQMLMDAEGRSGPNFGNLEVKAYLNGDLYERTANYLVLKGMVAHWEKKVIDANSLQGQEPTEKNYVTVCSEGDPRRFLPDAPILFTMKECTQVCYMAQQTTKAFVEDPELFGDLPPEVRFLEYATSIQGGTPMRKYMKEEFCPAEGITSAALREGMTRLMVQLENMQVDPYADIVNLLEKLIGAMSVGTEDEKEIYSRYLLPFEPSDPGYFPTYTLDYDTQSLVNFFDTGIGEKGGAGSSWGGGGGGGGGLDFENLFGGFGGGMAPTPKKAEPAAGASSQVPAARAEGRPHELGWLDLMADPDAPKQNLGKVDPGRIIPDSEDQEFNI